VRAAAALLDPVPTKDGIALAETVRSLAAGHGAALLDASHSPLAAALAAPFAAAGLDPLAALSLVAVLASAAAVLPLHAAARRAFDLDAANAGALLYAVTPPLVRIGSTALGEPLLFLLGMLSLDAALRALRHFRPAKDAALAGIAGGAALLARPEAWALLPLLLVAPLPAGGGRPWRNRLAGVAAGLLAFALVAGPWIAARSLHSGRLEIIPGKSAAVLLGSAPPADPGGAAPQERRGLPAAALRAAGAIPEALHAVPAVLALLGIATLVGRRGCGRALGPPVLLLCAAGFFLGGVALLEWRYGYGGRRHAAMAGVALVPFAGAGFLAAGNLLGRIGGPLRRPAVALGLLLVAVAVPLAALSLLHRDAGGMEAREMGRALRALAPAGAPVRVATFGEPRVAWYAAGEDVPLLREYGVRPGTAPADAARKGDALRWLLKRRSEIDFLVLRDDDQRVPPGVPGPAAGAPAAKAGGLRAWKASDAK
jgi:4-amino-4-deoxy-L-arabinose transferase-like glycosyltransferase